MYIYYIYKYICSGGTIVSEGDSLLHSAVSYGYIDDAYLLQLIQTSSSSVEECIHVNNDGEVRGERERTERGHF